MISLTSTALHFRCEPDHAHWGLFSQEDELSRVERARLSIRYRTQSGSVVDAFRLGWEVVRVDGPELTLSPHGACQQARVETAPNTDGIAARFEFALPEDHPFLLWRVGMENRGSQAVRVDRIEMLGGEPAGAAPGGCAVCLPAVAGQVGFYSNGWQSWSYSGTYLNGQRARRSRLGPLQNPMVINPGTPVTTRKGHFSGDFFGVVGDRRRRRGVLAGFLSQTQHFGSVEAQTVGQPTLRMWANGDDARLDPGASMTTDWAVLTFIDLDAPDPLGGYIEAVARENHVGPLGDVPVGWCSWYHFYSKVTAEDIQRNLHALQNMRSELPFRIMQIDDGFERRPGDWNEFRASFPQGVKPLGEQICAGGFTPGLWLAPFIVHPKAKLNGQHPEWILRDDRGRPVCAGYVWDSLTRGLDLTAPGALDFTYETVDRAAHEWGFPFIKLDFLYAAALPGKRHDPTLTRAKVLRQGLETLRAAAGPETTLLGCGAPLGSAVGLFEQMRVSCDVSGDWAPTYYNLHMVFKPEPHMPSVRNALQNTLVRAPFHRRLWINDPDCLLAREDTRLTPAEIQSMATAIAMTGGSLLLSDDLPAEMAGWLRIPQLLIPVIGRRARVMDWFDAHTPRRLRLDLESPAGAYSLLALFNWSNTRQPARLELKDYGIIENEGCVARSFWQKQTQSVEWGFVDLPEIAAHGVTLLALRPLPEGKPAYLGSDLHISQGLELAAWHADDEQVRLTLDLGRRASGEVELSLPRVPARVLLNGRSTPWRPVGAGRYLIAVELDGRGDVVVEMGTRQ